jgi:hypothetical protein
VDGWVVNRLAKSTRRPVRGFTMYFADSAGFDVHRHQPRRPLEVHAGGRQVSDVAQPVEVTVAVEPVPAVGAGR